MNLEGVVVRGGHEPSGDGWSWVVTFKAHRDTCRYARTADPITVYLEMWGLDHWRVMVEQDRITACKVCKPILL